MYVYIYTDKFVYMAHHFIMLRLNPFGLRADREALTGHSYIYIYTYI